MARTEQTIYRGPDPVWHKQTFMDHNGKPAIRVRMAQPDEPLPDNFQQAPIFCFQLYSTVPVDLDYSNDGPLADPRGSEDEAAWITLLYYIGHHELRDAQCPHPAYEIYSPLPDALSCVEHQRHEIAYRKARKADHATCLVPMLEHDYVTDHRFSGFMIVVTSDTFMTNSPFPNEDDQDEEGPLWIRFDRRFPSAITVEANPRHQYAQPTLTEWDDRHPEKLEIEIERKINLCDMQHNLKHTYHRSYGLENEGVNTWRGLAFDVDEGRPETGASVDAEDDLTEYMSLSGLNDAMQGVRIVDHGIEADPDLRYVVYAPFLHLPGQEHRLSIVAREFTSAMLSRLESGKTVTLDFRKPPKPTLSSIVKAHSSYMAAKPADYIGALNRVKSLDVPPDLVYQPEEPTIPTRLYPCTRSEDLPLNLRFERYQTFIIILDKPDFIDGSGVLFLLSDGGRYNKHLPARVGDWREPEPDIKETQVWRSPDMDTVVSRLAVQIAPQDHREEPYVASEETHATDEVTD